MAITDVLKSQVPATIRERGYSYFLSKAVQLYECLPTRVSAIVSGSLKYAVNLELDGQTMFASCSCPYVADYRNACKHIWATLLAAENRGFAPSVYRATLSVYHGESLDGDDFDDVLHHLEAKLLERARQRTHETRTPKKPHNNWKNQLASLSQNVQPSRTATNADRPVIEQLVFVVDATASSQSTQLVIEVNKRTQKKDGNWGRLKATSFNQQQISSLPDPLDRNILSLLRGAEQRDSYGYGYGYSYSYGYSYGRTQFWIYGAVLDAVLPLLAQSNRVRLRPNTLPRAELEELTVDLDPPWRLTVGVVRNGKNWVLSGQFHRGDQTMSLTEPLLALPGVLIAGNRMMRLEDNGSYGWLSNLRRVGSISIPVKSQNEFLGQLFQSPRLPNLELPEELRVAEEIVAPHPQVKVKSSNKQSHYNYLDIELSFDYAGQVVPALATERGVLLADEKRFLLRDADAERAAAGKMIQLGVCHCWTDGRAGLQLPPSALPKFVRELTAAGWRVEAEGKLYRQPGAFQIAVHTKHDWFDLNATAEFGGQKVAFPRLLAALRKGETSVVLDDGSLGMMPEEWLKKYGLLAQMGSIEGDSVRFTRAQVGVLDALLASRPEVNFDEQFAHARAELDRFHGVQAVDPPASFQGELRGYQSEGLGWLHFLRSFGFGGCLADDMGLGKTVQVLALLASKRSGPALVVVPRSLVFNWKQEAARFTPKLRVLDHTGTTRDKSGESFKDHDLILTTYGTLRNDAALFADYRFDTCVLDESQAAKNATTETAKAVRLIQADHRLALSGTPVENHLGELFTLFDYLNPGMLGRGLSAGAAGGSLRNPDAETREILAKALRPFILRRTKAQVAKDLPAKTEQTVHCDLESGQRKLYNELRDHYRRQLLARVDEMGLKKSKIQVLEALLRLRQAACHPGLIDTKRTHESSAKLDVLLPQLAEVMEEGHKALVFSQFTSLLAIVRQRLDADKIPYEYLDGRTRDRAGRVERFQTDPECRLFLVSLKAGGVGLNLTAAEYVFLLDPWWNPAVEAQAIDRSHRIGQTRPVFAYRLIARDTVEEKVLALQQSKRELADAILGGEGNIITDLKREDLELLLS